MKPRFFRSPAHIPGEPSLIGRLDSSDTDGTGDAALTRPKRPSLINKPAREIAVELTVFVMGVVILYGLDLTILSRSAPIAIQYMVQFCLYLNHHAVAAVETLY